MMQFDNTGMPSDTNKGGVLGDVVNFERVTSRWTKPGFDVRGEKCYENYG